MSIILSLIIPTLLILTPTIFQIVYTVKRIKNKTTMSLFTIFLLTLFLGFILPFAAFFISMYGLSLGFNQDEKKCLTGVEFIIFFGIGITIILTPLIGLTAALVQYFNTKRQNISPLS